MILSQKHRINILSKNRLLQKASWSHIFFHLKAFLWNGLLRVRKKIIDQLLAYISFSFEIQVTFSHKLLKQLSLIDDLDFSEVLNALLPKK